MRILISVLLAATAAPAISAPVSLPDPAVRLDAQKHEGHTLVRFEGVKDATTSPPVLKDLGSADQPGVEVSFLALAEVDKSADARVWLVKASAPGFPARTSQHRYMNAELGGVNAAIAYSLTNLPPSNFTWTLVGPSSPWIAWEGFAGSRSSTSLVVTSSSGQATGLRLAQASLREVGGGRELGLADLEICKSPDGPCQPPAAEGSSQTAHLRFTHRGRCAWPHGKFTGTIALIVHEKPEPQTLTVTLHSTSNFRKLVGIGLLLAGSFLGWWVNVFIRARVARTGSLLAANAVRYRAEQLLLALDERPEGSPSPAQLIGRVVRILASLATPSLDDRGLLPPETPSGIGSPADPTADLTAYLNEHKAVLAGLAVVVDQGLRPLWQSWRDAGMSEARKPIEEKLDALDRASLGITNGTDAKAAVEQALAPAPRVVADEATPTAVGVGVRLRRAAAQRQWEAWATWILVTVVGGAAVLVIPNAGFGTSQDLVFCFLWGVGLPVAVDRLQALGPGGIGGQLGVAVPKIS